MTQSETTQTTISTLLLTLALDAVAPFDTPVTEAGAFGRDSSFQSHGPCARLTTSDLLYAHHNLRC
jgi:hypothetical protein